MNGMTGSINLNLLNGPWKLKKIYRYSYLSSQKCHGKTFLIFTVVFNSVCPPFKFGHLHKILACRSFKSNKLFCSPSYANS